jgi:hypothetical protein
MKEEKKPSRRLFEEKGRLLDEAFDYRAETIKATGDGRLDVVSFGRRPLSRRRPAITHRWT